VNTNQAVLERTVLDAIGDGTRRAILELLATGPRSVGELASDLPVGRPAVSLHLRVLRSAELVTSTPAGTRNVYRLDPTGLAVLRRYLDRMWSAALDRFAEAAEAAHAAERTRSDPPSQQPNPNPRSSNP
jgi:DNA-binding transcriptional ArsR family regulator